MRIVCTGWYNVHTETKVLRDDGKGGLDSHSICIPCRDKFIALLPPKKEEPHEV